MPPDSLLVCCFCNDSLRAQEPYTTPSFTLWVLYHRFYKISALEMKKFNRKTCHITACFILHSANFAMLPVVEQILSAELFLPVANRAHAPASLLHKIL